MNAPKKSGRFTYGDQFDQDKTPLLELVNLCIEHEGRRSDLQEAIREKYFPGHGNSDNSKKMAMNCVLSLNAYRLIALSSTGKEYEVTDLTRELADKADDSTAMFKQFATHILTELDGLILLRLIENIRARGEQVTLEYLGEEMNDLGRKIPPNSTYISTMKSWLAKANVCRVNGWEVNWDVVYDLLHMDADAIDRLYDLTPEQRYFLLSMVCLDVKEFTPSNKIAIHARSVYSVRVTSKNLVKDVIEPIQQRGLIESQKTTVGRGAKPHDVRLTAKGSNDLIKPLLESIAQVTELTTADLNRTFEDVVSELNHKEKHVRGIALELFAVWIIRLLGLRFSKWRAKNFHETGGGEVDVMAASDKIVYSRWQIQCKNIKATSKVDIDTVAKEVGLTFLTKSDVVMMVTTGSFTIEAVNYANQVTDTSRYYIILLDGDDIKRIIADRAKIVDILNVKARRVFAKKELGLTEFGDEYIEEEDDGNEIGEEIAANLEQIVQAEPTTS